MAVVSDEWVRGRAPYAAQGAGLVPVAMAEREMIRGASSGSSGKSGPPLGSASTHWSITDWSERNESHTGTHHGE